MGLLIVLLYAMGFTFVSCLVFTHYCESCLLGYLLFCCSCTFSVCGLLLASSDVFCLMSFGFAVIDLFDCCLLS